MISRSRFATRQTPCWSSACTLHSLSLHVHLQNMIAQLHSCACPQHSTAKEIVCAQGIWRMQAALSSNHFPKRHEFDTNSCLTMRHHTAKFLLPMTKSLAFNSPVCAARWHHLNAPCLFTQFLASQIGANMSVEDSCDIFLQQPIKIQHHQLPATCIRPYLRQPW